MVLAWCRPLASWRVVALEAVELKAAIAAAVVHVVVAEGASHIFGHVYPVAPLHVAVVARVVDTSLNALYPLSSPWPSASFQFCGAFALKVGMSVVGMIVVGVLALPAVSAEAAVVRSVALAEVVSVVEPVVLAGIVFGVNWPELAVSADSVAAIDLAVSSKAV